MLDWNSCEAVACVPGEVIGARLFKGARVPVSALFENLQAGTIVADFLEWFTGRTRKQVRAVLTCAEQSLVAV